MCSHCYYIPSADVPPPPTVTISSDGDPEAGNLYTLTCMVTENLTADAVVMWLDSTGDPINLEDTLVGDVLQNGDTSTLQLTFNPLRTSHGQKYICTARIHFLEITSIPDTSSNTSFPVTVLSKCLTLHFYGNKVSFIVLTCSQFHSQTSPSHTTAVVFSMLGHPSPSVALFSWVVQWTQMWTYPTNGLGQDLKKLLTLDV